MQHIDFGLGVFSASAFDSFPRAVPVDPRMPKDRYVSRENLVGYEAKLRLNRHVSLTNRASWIKYCTTGIRLSEIPLFVP